MIDIIKAQAIIKKAGCFEVYQIENCIDIGDRFAFVFRLKSDKPGFPAPGLPVICVNKTTEELSILTVPPMENLDLLNNGKEIECPTLDE